MIVNSANTKAVAIPRKSIDALRVLVVDDDPFQLEFISDTLRSLGVSDITCAASGEKARDAIVRSKTQSPFDLLLSDLYMPGMDGFEFMASAVQAGFKVALIIVSGQGGDVMHSASLVAQLRRFNLLGTLPKPLDKAALAALLSKLG
jgi:CheY-like chemotaxis protein